MIPFKIVQQNHLLGTVTLLLCNLERICYLYLKQERGLKMCPIDRDWRLSWTRERPKKYHHTYKVTLTRNKFQAHLDSTSDLNESFLKVWTEQCFEQRKFVFWQSARRPGLLSDEVLGIRTNITSAFTGASFSESVNSMWQGVDI